MLIRILAAAALVSCFTLGLRAQTVVGDFECQTSGQSFAFSGSVNDCEGWTDESLIVTGPNSVADASIACPGMPSAGNQFGQVLVFPSFAGPTNPFFAPGNTTPRWPFISGNVSIISKTVFVTDNGLSLDWKLLKSATSAGCFAQVLLVDLINDQLIAPVLVTDSSVQTLTTAEGCTPAGGPVAPLDGTVVQTTTAPLPTTLIGAAVKLVVCVAPTGVATVPTGGQFVDAALFVDNIRFVPTTSTAKELVFAPGASFVAGNPAGPGPVTINATVNGFRDDNGFLETDPTADPVIGASCSITANLLGSGLDLDGAILSVANIDVTVVAGQDELGILGQFNHDPTGDEFALGGALEVIPFVRRPLPSAVIANAARTGSGSTVLDDLEQQITLTGSDLALVFDIAPGQLPQLQGLVLDFVAHPKPPVFNFDTNGTGDIVLGVAGTNPSDELFNVFVPNPTVNQGAGPFFGLEFTPLVADILASPLGSIPFHVAPDADGAFFWGLPPGSLPAGLVLDAAAGTLDPATGSPTWVSSVIRRSF
jgi:hypothetical protein